MFIQWRWYHSFKISKILFGVLCSQIIKKHNFTKTFKTIHLNNLCHNCNYRCNRLRKSIPYSSEKTIEVYVCNDESLVMTNKKKEKYITFFLMGGGFVLVLLCLYVYFLCDMCACSKFFVSVSFF